VQSTEAPSYALSFAAHGGEERTAAIPSPTRGDARPEADALAVIARGPRIVQVTDDGDPRGG